VLAAFGPWMKIAFIEDEDGENGKRYFASVIDADCPIEQRPGKLPSRRPRYRVELPGFPILGHGKSDNQNCAVIYTRGEVLQMIDCNQEAYFEASLFLPLALQEFSSVRNGRRPGILGFREHIFSDIGLLGRLAADSEYSFGTIIQRTMDWPLQARLHYGHPDMMDKLQVLQQGGVSKATKGLNLSEDVFAGLDLTLRGGWTTYKEYFHVGKGRDMGFMSVLSFFSKVSMGNGEQVITRQWLRLGLTLPLPKFLGIFYTHCGFFLNQCLVNWAIKAFAFMMAIYTVLAPMDLGIGDAAAGLAGSYFGFFYFLFMIVTVLPLLWQVFIEQGVCASLNTILSAMLALSPVFSAFQSKLMGYYFWSTMHYGGAQYIATGRGLATSREGFARLFRYFAATHMHDGMELVLYLFISSTTNYGWAIHAALVFTVIAWLFAPFVFNPRQFEKPSQACQDLRQWLNWMWSTEGGEDDAWLAYSLRLQEVRRNASHAVERLPSGRLLALIVTTGIMVVCGAFYDLLIVERVTLLMPPLAHFLFCVLLSICEGLFGDPDCSVCSYPLLSLTAVALTLLELGMNSWWEATARMVLFHKYICLRYMLEVADGVAARESGGPCLSWLHTACRRWALSWRFLRDLLLGWVLAVICILAAMIPGLSGVHDIFLFRARLNKGRYTRPLREAEGQASRTDSSDSDRSNDSDSDEDLSESGDALVATGSNGFGEASDPLLVFVRRFARGSRQTWKERVPSARKLARGLGPRSRSR